MHCEEGPEMLRTNITGNQYLIVTDTQNYSELTYLEE